MQHLIIHACDFHLRLATKYFKTRSANERHAWHASIIVYSVEVLESTMGHVTVPKSSILICFSSYKATFYSQLVVLIQSKS